MVDEVGADGLDDGVLVGVVGVARLGRVESKLVGCDGVTDCLRGDLRRDLSLYG